MPSWFYDKSDLQRSPSILSGIAPERESRYRREGSRFIINVGSKMGLRYDTVATGVVYFHRFYMFHSFETFPRFISACCCLFLAGKVEETPKKCKDVIRIAKSFLTDAQFTQFGDDPKEELMTLERILLQTIKFDLQVDHPYGYLLKYAKCLRGDPESIEKMVQKAWIFINDSLCTTLCLQWEPEVIAIAMMYLAGKLSKFEIMDWNGRTAKHNCWWDMYVEGMSKELLEDICHQLLDLYSMPVTDTPQDSPPATPPSKSTIKKVLPIQNIASPISTPVSPVPAVKLKHVLVGQPIPCLEPGELKRKATKPFTRKDSTESKPPRPATATTKVEKPRMSDNSPKSLQAETDAAVVSTDMCIVTTSSSSTSSNSNHSSSNQLKDSAESSQQISVVQLTVAPTADILNTTVSQASASTAQNQYLPSYSRPMTFVAPDPGITYFPGGQHQASAVLQPAFIQNSPYLSAQTQPTLANSSGQPQQLTNLQPPPPPLPPRPPLPPPPNAAAAAAPPMPPYPSQGPPTQFPPPPQLHNATPIAQYPPSHTKPTANMLPNVSLPPPPPNPPTHLSQHPHLPMPPNMTQPLQRAPLPPGMPPNPVSMPPVLPPPSQMPHPFPPRPELDNRMREHPPGAIPRPPQAIPRPPQAIPRPPRYLGHSQDFGHHEGHPQDFGHRDGPPQDFAHCEGRPQDFAHHEGRPQEFAHHEGRPQDFAHHEGHPPDFGRHEGHPRDFGCHEGHPQVFGHHEGHPQDFGHHERHPQDFGQRSHFEQDHLLPPPHFREQFDGDFNREQLRDERYSDFSRGPPFGAFGREFDNPMQPFQRYGHERGPPPHERGPPHSGPRMKNPLPPFMETPTGIPPVRITGSGYVPGHPMG